MSGSIATAAVLLALAVTGLAADDTRTRARLLHLHGEGVVRGDTRFVDDHWEIRRDGAWTPLPPGAVREARLEKDVLAESRKRLGEVRRAGADERAEVARWMAREGLLTETFELVEELLVEDPDHADTLELLADLAPTIGLPRVDPFADDLRPALEPLLDYAAVAPMALRELAVLRLDEVEDREQLRAIWRDDLRHADGGRRQFALLGLRRRFADAVDEDVARELLRRALYDRYADVRRHASLTMAASGERGLETNVAQALASPHAAVRVHAAQALATMKATTSVGALVQHLSAAAGRGDGSGPRATAFFGTQRAFVQGFEAEVAQNATIANPLVGTLQEGATIDVKVLGVSSSPYGGAAERTATRTALETITGADPGSSPSAWARWWEENRAEWTATSAEVASDASPYR